eukprot:11017662-Alexandrium_andersonii.AAC.1
MQETGEATPTQDFWNAVTQVAALADRPIRKGKVLAEIPAAFASALGAKRLRPGANPEQKRHTKARRC